MRKTRFHIIHSILCGLFFILTSSIAKGEADIGWSAPKRGSRLTVQALRIRFLPEALTLELMDITELTLGHARLSAQSGKVVMRPLRIEITQFDMAYPLGAGQIRLKGRAATCEGGNCRLAQTALYPCPWDAPGLSLHSQEVHIEEDTITLSSMRLRLGNATLFGLPRLRLLPDTHVGFLSPILGWSPEFGLRAGPRLYVPLHDGRFAVLQGAVRTGMGMDSGFTLTGKRDWLRFDHLRHHGRNMFSLKALAAYQPSVGNVAMDAHMVSERKVIDELSFSSLDRATRQTESRFYYGVSTRYAALENELLYVQALPNDTAVPDAASVHLGVALYPLIHRLPGVQPELSLAIDRITGAPQSGIVSQSRFMAVPKVIIPFTFAYLPTRIQLGVLLQRRQMDATALGESHVLPGMMITTGLPLIKRGRLLQHLLYPRVSMRLAPFEKGSSPSLLWDYHDAASGGMHVQLALQNIFGNKLHHPGLTITPSLHWLGDVELIETGHWYFGLEASAASQWLRLEMAGSLRQGAKQLNDGRVTVAVDESLPLGFATTLFYRPSTSYEAFALVPGDEFLWPMQFPAYQRGYTILAHQMNLPLSPFVRLTADAQFALNPGISLAALSYAVEISTKCHCLTAALSAAHRPQRSAPDIMLNVVWQPGKPAFESK